MADVYGIEPNKLINEVAKKLEERGEIVPPKFISYSKTGPHVEFGPENKKFWYVRCASILRQAYVNCGVSVGGLRVHYGGRKRHRVASAHHVDAGGSVIRKAMQQLEAAGLLKKGQKGGRIITNEGIKLLNSVAKGIKE